MLKSTHRTEWRSVAGSQRLVRKPRLWSIAYHSRMTSPLSTEQLTDLVLGAMERNHKIDVSGVLLFDQNYFFQILEGHCDFVEEIYASIEVDPRHTCVAKVVDAAITNRAFARWDMRLVTTDDLCAEESAIVSAALRAVERLSGEPSEPLRRACLDVCATALRLGVIHTPHLAPTPFR